MRPRSTPTVRLPSIAALPQYSDHTNPGIARHTPVIPVHSHLQRHVPFMATSPILPRHPKYTHDAVHPTIMLSPSPMRISPLPGPSCCSPNSLLRPQVQGGVLSHALQRRRRCHPPPRRLVNPGSNPRNHPRDCYNWAASRDPGVMGIPYRGLGLNTLVGTTHDTSLLYMATRGTRVKHPSPTLVHGGSTAHHQAGTTCHTALAVIRRMPSPHTQAMRTLLPMSHLRRCVQHKDRGKCTHISHTLSSCITPGPHASSPRPP